MWWKIKTDDEYDFLDIRWIQAMNAGAAEEIVMEDPNVAGCICVGFSTHLTEHRSGGVRECDKA